MRKKLIHNMFACLLCVTLLFTMGYGIEARINNFAEPAPGPSVEINSKVQLTDNIRSFIEQPDTENVPPAELVSSEPALQPMPINQVQRMDEQTDTEKPASNYEVTAYYLNVRAEADGTSKIINVVTKGSVLEVIKPTDNGWLELKSGGYIHGNYAKAIAGDVKPPVHAEKLAEKIPDVQTAAKKVVVLSSEPVPDDKPAEPGKPSSAVKSNSGLTEEHIAKIIKDTDLEGEGLEKAILEIEDMYGINSYFTIAVMKLESGHGKSQIAKTKNNLFGLNAVDSDPYNKAMSFKTKGESVRKFGHIISEFYIDKGLTSVEKVARKYCAANSKWPALVKSIMKSDYEKIS